MEDLLVGEKPCWKCGFRSKDGLIAGYDAAHGWVVEKGNFGGESP
jgi:hypothetical protein